MARSNEQLSPDRLADTASAVMQAVAEFAASHGQQRPYPPSLMGSPAQPSCLDGFSKWEVQQATDFLVRLGFLDRSKTRGVR